MSCGHNGPWSNTVISDLEPVKINIVVSSWIIGCLIISLKALLIAYVSLGVETISKPAGEVICKSYFLYELYELYCIAEVIPQFDFMLPSV